MATVPTGPQDHRAPPNGRELARERPTPAGSGQPARALARSARAVDNRRVAESTHEGDWPPEAGDWRTSPTTGELEFFDGRDWVSPGTERAGGSDLLIRPAPPGRQPPGAEDAAGSGPDSG